MMPTQKTPETPSGEQLTEKLSSLYKSEKPTLSPREQLIRLTLGIINHHNEQTRAVEKPADLRLSLNVFLLAQRVEVNNPSDTDSPTSTQSDSLVRLSYCDTAAGIEIPASKGRSKGKDGTISRIQIRTSDGAVKVTEEATVEKEQIGRPDKPDRPERFDYVTEIKVRTFDTPLDEELYIQEFLDKIEKMQRIGKQEETRRKQERFLGRRATLDDNTFLTSIDL
jgi:hypothetical protein